MAEVKENESRENRIAMEVVVDAYDAEERAMGWYYYLEETLSFPFLAKCTAKRAISPLQVGDEINVTELAPMDECYHEIFVMIPWEKDGLGVPLSQVNVNQADEKTKQVVEDWHYWVGRGYEF